LCDGDFTCFFFLTVCTIRQLGEDFIPTFFGIRYRVKVFDFWIPGMVVGYNVLYRFVLRFEGSDSYHTPIFVYPYFSLSPRFDVQPRLFISFAESIKRGVRYAPESTCLRVENAKPAGYRIAAEYDNKPGASREAHPWIAPLFFKYFLHPLCHFVLLLS